MKQLEKLAIDGGNPVRTKPFPRWPVYGELEEKLILEVLKSGNWGGVDPDKIIEFEQKFAGLQDAKYALAVSNGTGALSLSLMACGVDIGDEVITTPYTFNATTSATLMIGAIPVFVDINENMQLDASKVEAAITPKTKAIITVHLGGATADITKLKEIAKRHKLALIEDAAQAVGSRWEDRGVGSIGDIGTFSLQGSKNLNCGEGGVILTDNRELGEKVIMLHNSGRMPEGSIFEQEQIGYNFRLTEFQAALVLAQMSRLEEQMSLREQNAKLLNQMLEEIKGLKVIKNDSRLTRNSYHIYMIGIDSDLLANVEKVEFIQKLNAEGIPAAGGYEPLNRNRAVINRTKQIVGKEQIYDCPLADKACKSETIWLGQNVLLGTEEDMHDVVSALRKVVDSYI